MCSNWAVRMIFFQNSCLMLDHYLCLRRIATFTSVLFVRHLYACISTQLCFSPHFYAPTATQQQSYPEDSRSLLLLLLHCLCLQSRNIFQRLKPAKIEPLRIHVGLGKNIYTCIGIHNTANQISTQKGETQQTIDSLDCHKRIKLMLYNHLNRMHVKTLSQWGLSQPFRLTV